MTFINPVALWLLAGVPVLLALAWWRDVQRRARFARLGDAAVTAQLLAVNGQALRWAGWGLSALAASCVIIALARPSWGISYAPQETSGVAVMLVLDVSNSMNAQDLAPSRLSRAKLTATDFINGLAGGEVGLVLVAGEAFVRFPLTTDIFSALTFLNTANSEALSHQGTALEGGLRLAVERLQQSTSTATQRRIVLLSDGEALTGDVLAAAESAREAGIVVDAIGFGTLEGAPVPILDESGNISGYKTAANGAQVTSRLDEATLSAIAERTGGVYQRAAVDGADVRAILDAVQAVQSGQVTAGVEATPIEQFGWFVGLAWLAWTAEIALSLSRRRGLMTKGLLPLLLLGLAGCGVSAAERNQAGNEAFSAADYPNAARAYQAAQVLDPDRAEPYLNAGNAFAGAGELDKAVQNVQQGLLTANEAQAEWGYYNLGTLYFAASLYPEAVRAYMQALLIDPSDADARYNLELALKQIRPPSQDSATPQPSGGATPSASESPTPDQPTPQATPDRQDLSQAEAEQLLDSVGQAQQVLPDAVTPSSSQTGKDW